MKTLAHKLHAWYVQAQHHGRMQQRRRRSAGAYQPPGFLPAEFWGAPMMDLLQAPAMGLLTSALAAPDLILSITIKKCV